MTHDRLGTDPGRLPHRGQRDHAGPWHLLFEEAEAEAAGCGTGPEPPDQQPRAARAPAVGGGEEGNARGEGAGEAGKEEGAGHEG